MKENKATIFNWVFVVKNPKLNGVQKNFDFGTSRWHSDASYEGDSFFLVGTQEESSDFYKDLIENGYSVQDKYNLGEKK